MKAADEPKCAVQPTVTLGRDTGVPSQAKYFVACRQSSLSLLLRGWRLQAVEAEVHGGGAVMVGPVVGEGDQSESPRCFAAAPQSSIVSPSVASVTFGIVVLQKSNEDLRAATSLSLPSVSFSS